MLENKTDFELLQEIFSKSFELNFYVDKVESVNIDNKPVIINVMFVEITDSGHDIKILFDENGNIL